MHARRGPPGTSLGVLKSRAPVSTAIALAQAEAQCNYMHPTLPAYSQNAPLLAVVSARRLAFRLRCIARATSILSQVSGAMHAAAPLTAAATHGRDCCGV